MTRCEDRWEEQRNSFKLFQNHNSQQVHFFQGRAYQKGKKRQRKEKNKQQQKTRPFAFHFFLDWIHWRWTLLTNCIHAFRASRWGVFGFCSTVYYGTACSSFWKSNSSAKYYEGAEWYREHGMVRRRAHCSKSSEQRKGRKRNGMLAFQHEAGSVCCGTSHILCSSPCAGQWRVLKIDRLWLGIVDFHFVTF